VTDDRLRDLERRWRASGSPVDEGAWLAERIRAGDRLDWDGYARLAALDPEAAAADLRRRREAGELSRDALDLAAYCGHAPARAVASGAPSDAAAAASLEGWGLGLPRWGLGHCVRAAVAAGEALRAGAGWTTLSAAQAGLAGDALASGAAVLADPTAERRREADARADAAKAARRALARRARPETPAARILGAAAGAADAASRLDEPDARVTEAEWETADPKACFWQASVAITSALALEGAEAELGPAARAAATGAVVRAALGFSKSA